jgi:U1 small nuclear ribonucleoprotein
MLTNKLTRSRLSPHVPPADIKALFEPKELLPIPPGDVPRKLSCVPSSLTGVSAYLADLSSAPPAKPGNTVMLPPDDRRLVKRLQTQAAAWAGVEAGRASWDPAVDPNTTGNAMSTLFVARLNPDTTDKTLQKEFEKFGPVVQVRIVRDTKGRSRKYGFVEFESEADVRAAFRKADGLEIDGKKIVCDVERGRTVRGWLPRRLGGGLGKSREEKPRAKADPKKAERIYPRVGESRVIG